jgi:beta-hydroxylase
MSKKYIFKEIVMKTYNEYHLDPTSFPFLLPFKNEWKAIREEYKNFALDAVIDFAELSKITTPQSKTIKTKALNTYKAFTLLLQGKPFLDFIKDYQVSWPEIQSEKMPEMITPILEKHFPKTLACIHEAQTLAHGLIRNIYFSVFEPGLDIKCHINYNPHTYRAYLGLIVPPGDIAMKIGGEQLNWHEGEIMVLDHNFPHCPHNRTNQARVALIIDFLKPEKPFNDMLELESQLFKKRMQDNPYSFGIFSDEDYIKPEDLKKFGFKEQEEWNKNLF